MRAILAMVGKDLRLLARDRMGFFFTFIFPLMIAIFFGTMFSGSGREPRGLSIAVVDEDQSPESRAFAASLDTVPEFSAEAMDRAKAKESVTLGKRVAYVLLPVGFGELKQRPFYGPGPEVELGLDPSRKAEGGMIQGVLTKYLAEDIQAISERSRWQPVHFRTTDVMRQRLGPRNAYEVSFPQGVLWAILNGAFGFAMALVNERMRGTFVRLRMAPLTRGQILAAKAGAALIAIITVATIVLAIGAAVFHVRPSSIPLLALAVISAASALTGIMLLISASGTTPRGVSGLGWAVMMTMSMTGGAMIPLFAMPAWMQTASMASPVRWAITALEGAIWRGFTPAQMALPCAILLSLSVIGFAVGTRILRRTEA